MTFDIVNLLNSLGMGKVKKIYEDLDYFGIQLAELITLKAKIDYGYKFGMDKNLPWPGEKYWEPVHKYDEIENSIRSKLDLRYKEDQKFYNAILDLKNTQDLTVQEDLRRNLFIEFDLYKAYRLRTKNILFR